MLLILSVVSTICLSACFPLFLYCW